jgi:hypothetical protein
MFSPILGVMEHSNIKLCKKWFCLPSSNALAMLKKLKHIFYKLLKIWKYFWRVFVIHPTIMQYLNPKFFSFWAKKKKTKSDMFWRFENDYSNVHFCHFSETRNIKYFKFIFCTFLRYIVDYMLICFQNFLKLKKYDFWFFWKQDD